ncbi:hypothetical protein [Neokomagataea tanensis]|uniref:hypothetical protein n=1 Tax=Neokomagataea TaxID=1223423 RepID=UPI0011438B92|nr:MULTISPECIES: hypothetical protein [Neokomagataea]
MSEQPDMQSENSAIERIESVFERLASLVKKQAEEREALLRKYDEQPNVQEIAANIDALCMRIETVLAQAEDK